jgi:hypothetical protein
VDAIGAQLRERTTVGTAGLITLLTGALPCRAVGIWAASFRLDNDPGTDPLPRFGAPYTGRRPLAVRLPSASSPCSAAAVFFTVDADEATDRAAARRAAVQVRAELASWPTNATAFVPGGSILRGRSSAVLAGSVVGDPSGCSPGESVDSPFARVGDCWTALPAGTGTGPSAPAGGGAASNGTTRFRRTTCSEQHTHEVYWADRLMPKQYVAEGQPAGLAAAVWARKRADEVCAKQSASIALARGVSRNAIFLEYLWPATLSYPPTGAAGWSRAQVVCLARWKNGQAATRQLLTRPS